MTTDFWTEGGLDTKQLANKTISPGTVVVMRDKHINYFEGSADNAKANFDKPENRLCVVVNISTDDFPIRRHGTGDFVIYAYSPAINTYLTGFHFRWDLASIDEIELFRTKLLLSLLDRPIPDCDMIIKRWPANNFLFELKTDLSFLSPVLKDLQNGA